MTDTHMTQAGAHIRINGEDEPLAGGDAGGAAGREGGRCRPARDRGRAQRRRGSARGLAANAAQARRQCRDRARAPRWLIDPELPMTVPQMPKVSDPLIIAGREFGSRLFLGTAGYPNRKLMLDAIAASGTQMVTASIRRISLAGDDESLVDLIPKHIHFLPNTAGCQTAKDAVLTAELAREALDSQLDQARGDRRPRAALSRHRGIAARDRDAGGQGFHGAALLHRGSGGLPQARRCGRRRGDAARLADRLGARRLPIRI